MLRSPLVAAVRSHLTDRFAITRCARIALVVGTILSAANEGDVIAQGRFSPAMGAKVALNYLVPFVVSSLGFISARRAG